MTVGIRLLYFLDFEKKLINSSKSGKPVGMLLFFEFLTVKNSLNFEKTCYGEIM